MFNHPSGFLASLASLAWSCSIPQPLGHRNQTCCRWVHLTRRLRRSRDLDPSIVATAVKDLEVKDALECLPNLNQARETLFHAFGHGIGWGRIHHGANMEDPERADGFE